MKTITISLVLLTLISGCIQVEDITEIWNESKYDRNLTGTWIWYDEAHAKNGDREIIFKIEGNEMLCLFNAALTPLEIRAGTGYDPNKASQTPNQ